MNIHVFTYGTLRPDGALQGAMSGTHIGPAVLPDAAMFRHRHARFPVVDVNSPGQDVVGDVFSVPISELAFVVEMELGAGYDVTFRTVTLNDDTYTEVTALVFAWPDYRPVGPFISCGDWLSVEAATVCSDLHHNAGFTTRRKANQ